MSGDPPFDPPGGARQPWQAAPPPAPQPPPYPPPQQPPYGVGQPPGPNAPRPPTKPNRTPWIVLGVVLGGLVLLIGGCAALVIFAAASDDELREAIGDFTVDFTGAVPAQGPVSCEVTGVSSGGITVDNYDVIVTVTNTSGVTSAYRITYELFGADGESLGTDFGIIRRVEPDDTIRDESLGVISDSQPWTGVTCEVVEALRAPAD